MVIVRFKDGTEASFADGAWSSITPGLGLFLELLYDPAAIENHAGYDNPRRGMIGQLEKEFGAVLVQDDGMRCVPGRVY